MALTSAKNKMTPGAASADLGLGLGDQLADQLQDQLAQRKKVNNGKIKGNQDQNPYNPGGLSMAAQSLGLAAGVPR